MIQRRNLHGQRQLFTTGMDFMSSFPRPLGQYFSRHHSLPVLVNTTNTRVYNMFIAQHIYFHLLQSSRVNRNTPKTLKLTTRTPRKKLRHPPALRLGSTRLTRMALVCKFEKNTSGFKIIFLRIPSPRIREQVI